MFGPKYRPSELDYSSWITLAHAIDAVEKSLESKSENINQLKQLLMYTIKENSEIEKISGFEFNSILDIISHTLKWDIDFGNSLILENNESLNSLLVTEFRSLMVQPNIPKEQIFEPLKEVLSDYIEFSDDLDIDLFLPEMTFLLVLGIAIATLRDESNLDTKRNMKLRRDNACSWYTKFTFDWIYNFGNVDYLNRENELSAGEETSNASPSPFNPLSW